MLLWGLERLVLTLGHVGELIFTHGLEGGSFELALDLRGDTKEVDCECEDTNNASEDGEGLGGGHGVGIRWFDGGEQK